MHPITQADRDRDAFLREISKELREENVAIFAGAGLSAPAGFVGWMELLRPIATDLGLDVEKEKDLVTLAQYHLNENNANRSQLNKRLIEEFSRNASITENHRILARLPIKTYWTTNYDNLIEKSLDESGKVADVKYTKKQLAITKPHRDAIVYKMHGDISHPDNAILTKDDYESYHIKMDQFINTLSGDLVVKTFIFIGFSFTDPNLDYILSRVRNAYDKSQRQHYCFLKRVAQEENESVADYNYRNRKQELFCGDLSRFNIKPLLVTEYSEITEALKIIENRFKQKTIFISGAAHEYNHWGTELSQKFIYDLSKIIIQRDYKIVSGFGLGVGNAVISGALEQIYMEAKKNNADQLILRPFPQAVYGKTSRPELWRKYRHDMTSYAGIAIFIFGNKKVDNSVVLSNGMLEEFELAKENNLFIIPVAATGFVALQIWNTIKEEFCKKYETNTKLVDLFEKLADTSISPEEVIRNVVAIIETIQKIS